MIEANITEIQKRIHSSLDKLKKAPSRKESLAIINLTIDYLNIFIDRIPIYKNAADHFVIEMCLRFYRMRDMMWKSKAIDDEK